jgi:hypothetical protein
VQHSAGSQRHQEGTPSFGPKREGFEWRWRNDGEATSRCLRSTELETSP